MHVHGNYLELQENRTRGAIGAYALPSTWIPKLSLLEGHCNPPNQQLTQQRISSEIIKKVLNIVYNQQPLNTSWLPVAALAGHMHCALLLAPAQAPDGYVSLSGTLRIA